MAKEKNWVENDFSLSEGEEIILQSKAQTQLSQKSTWGTKRSEDYPLPISLTLRFYLWLGKKHRKEISSREKEGEIILTNKRFFFVPSLKKRDSYYRIEFPLDKIMKIEAGADSLKIFADIGGMVPWEQTFRSKDALELKEKIDGMKKANS